MYSLTNKNVVRALFVGASVFALVLCMTAAILLVAPQGVAHADEYDLDFGGAEWGGDSGGDWGGDCCSDWGGGDECCYDSGDNDCCYDSGYDDCCYDSGDDGCYDYCGGGDGCYDYCGDDDSCYDYCGEDDYNDDYCDYECNDYDDDYCDDECDEFYEEEEVSDHYQTSSSGAKYSSSGSMPKFSMPSYSSAPMKFANQAPSYHAQPTRQNPVYIPNQPAPVYQATPVSNNTVITNTSIDNSINDSFNDNSYNDYSINGSFNNYNSNNTAVAIGGTWGSVTPIASVTPGHTIAAVIPSYTHTTYVPPVVRANPQYVALSQIPYTGFDLGPVGNTIYWMSLMSIAAAGAYLLVYFKGGALSFAGTFMPRPSTSLRVNAREDLPVLPTITSVEKKETAIVSSTTDTMTVSDKGIVINRSY